MSITRWSAALWKLHRDYPDIHGEVVINDQGITVRVRRWYQGHYYSTMQHIDTYQIENAKIDVVMEEIARCTSRLLLLPTQQAVKLRIIAGKDAGDVTIT